jgi:hypothetical protein
VHLVGHPYCSKYQVPGDAQSGLYQGDVPILGLSHFVHTHVLCEEPDHSISMLYEGWGQQGASVTQPSILAAFL